MHHFRTNPFQWWTGFNELRTSATNYGTVMEEGVPGLVFVLWAR